LSEALETAIRDILINEKDTSRVAEELFGRMDVDEETLTDERTAFTNFLINAGHYEEVIKLYSRWFKKKESHSLRSFCYTLNKNGFTPNETFSNYLFKAKKESAEKLDLWLSDWEGYDRRFAAEKKTAVQSAQKQYDSIKKNLFNKLEYLRANRMINEEEKLIDQLIVMMPENLELKQQKNNFQERWARAIIARKSFESLDTTFDNPSRPLDTETETIVLAITQEMIVRSESNSTLVYDFAIALYFLEQYEVALQILAYASPIPNLKSKSSNKTNHENNDKSIDWFKIELLIKSRRYVESLDFISIIEKKYAADPETSFAGTYAKALTLYGLHQQSTATELLKSIVNIRPNYRSAHSLLQKWTGKR
jgi:hypothetical protein